MNKNTYYHPATGVCVRSEFRPDAAWQEVAGPANGQLLRVRHLHSGRWEASRVHWMRYQEFAAEGWERVTWNATSVPTQWFTGERSSLRFGFADLTKEEQRSVEDSHFVAVVLPDEPGWVAPAHCPGARYTFQLVMLVGGVPADYLIEKLLHARRPCCGLSRASRLQTGFEGAFTQPDFEKTRLGSLWKLATHLSDDLREVTPRLYGSEHHGSAWTREMQTRIAARDVIRN